MDNYSVATWLLHCSFTMSCKLNVLLNMAFQMNGPSHSLKPVVLEVEL